MSPPENTGGEYMSKGEIEMKKTLAIVLCIVMCAALLAACGSSAKPAAAEEKTLIVATNVAFPPYEYYENEKAVGIDIDIMQAICDKLGYKMQVDDMEFGSIIIAVQTGKADVGAGGLTITEERKQSVDFTDSYATGIQAVIVTEDSAIASVDDLYADDVVIGVQQDTTGDIYCTDDFGEDHVARFNKGADAVQALLTGKCQAVVIDNSPAKTFVEQNAGLKILPTAYAEEEYAFEIAKENTELYDAVNGALKELLADGTIQAIIDKYISAD